MARAGREQEARETAWRVFGATQDWIGKVDSKASFAFGFEVAIITAAVALTGKGKPLGVLDSWVVSTLFAAGLVLLGVAVLTSSLVIAPRITARKTPPPGSEDFIYFGHLRMWDADELRRAFRDTSPTPGLSKQIVILSKIAWRKHRLVQLSVSLSVVGGLCLIACFFASKIG